MNTPRSLRRHVRIVCHLRQGGKQWLGRSSNVSANGLHVRVPLGTADLEVLRAGGVFELSFELPDRAQLVHTQASIVWVDVDDHDVGGAPCLGIGMALLEPGREVIKRLADFVEAFRYTVLAVDDEPDNVEVMRRILSREYRFIGCVSAADALKVLEREEVAILITDERMPDLSGLDFLRRVGELMPHSHVIRILVSAYPAADLVQEFVNVGKIFHFVRKPVTVQDVLPVVRRAIDAYAMTVENERLNAELERANLRLRHENDYLRRRVEAVQGFEGIIGASTSLRHALVQLDRIRESDVTVHIRGETGTGKELVARALHFGGPRKDGPFVAHNCAGMTEALQQSTLFGHKRGAFTGAERDHQGVFQRAHGGTLFLDEVGDLTPAVQGSLLRALQEGEITPLGSSENQHIDVRIISATHKDLRELVRSGAFREDLYFRLVVIGVHLPALRERVGDIPLLAQHLLDVICERRGKHLPGFTTEAVRALEQYVWPGNVRELENEVERVVVLGADGRKADVQLLSPHIQAAARQPARVLTPAGDGDYVVKSGVLYDEAVEMLERMMVERALAAADGNLSAAAGLLGVERSRLGKIRRRLGLVS